MEIQISESFPLNFIVIEDFIKQKWEQLLLLNWTDTIFPQIETELEQSLFFKYISKIGSKQKIRLFSHYSFRIQV